MHAIDDNNIAKYLFAPFILCTQEKSKPSHQPTFPFQAVIRDEEKCRSAYVEARHTVLATLKHIRVTTSINGILG